MSLTYPGTTHAVLSVANRGTISGTQNIPSGVMTGVMFFFVSSQWAPGDGKTMNISVDRSFDAGLNWSNEGMAGSVGAAPVAVPSTKDRADGMPYLIFKFDGLAALYRWTLVPLLNGQPTSFSWGASAIF